MIDVIVTAYWSDLEEGRTQEYLETLGQTCRSILGKHVNSVVVVLNSTLIEPIQTLDLSGVKPVAPPEGEPRGALASAMLGLAALKGKSQSNKILIWPGDTVAADGLEVHLGEICEMNSSAGMFTFRNPGDGRKWSFVVLNDRNEILEIHEGAPETDHAAVGLFWFKNAETFEQAARWCFENDINTNGNFYTSAAINYLISQGRSLGQVPIEGNLFEKKWNMREKK